MRQEVVNHRSVYNNFYSTLRKLFSLIAMVFYIKLSFKSWLIDKFGLLLVKTMWVEGFLSFYINVSNSALLPTWDWGWTASVSDCQKNETQIQLLLSFFLEHGLSPKTK